ncbi:hypothetical protein ACFSMW_14310 [Virgibacillus halophilus]|uniref:Uncharacterized protein n=1 Tax=Tigheibacillus halophilus TaxID=361280 RepID=A0ABU5C1Y9_9BACI|nr:hypothetical protein [Virgibacillus halophilus]
MNKLTGDEADLLQKVIEDNDHVIQVGNKRYYVTIMEEPKVPQPNKNILKEEVQDYQLKKRNILKGKEFSIDDVVEMIDMGII